MPKPPETPKSAGSSHAAVQADVREKGRAKGRAPWYDYLWIVSALYLALGVFNILFAWAGLLCFVIPLLIAALRGNKAYCGRYCGRGQLFEKLGGRLGLSRGKTPPRFLRSRWFRRGFLAYFMTMFGLMLWATAQVFAGAPLKKAVTLLWVFRLPWHWADVSAVHPGAAQFAFGFYGVMLTSTVLGLLTMLLFKPRSWCVYCPMGTMTQEICRLKARGREPGKIKTKEGRLDEGESRPRRGDAAGAGE